MHPKSIPGFYYGEQLILQIEQCSRDTLREHVQDEFLAFLISYLQYRLTISPDPIKNKYFAEQKGVPASSAYSAADVKRRRLNQEYAASEGAKTAAQQLRIQRSTALQDAMSGGFLLREQGLASLDLCQIFASGLIPSSKITNKYDPVFNFMNPLFEMERRTDIGPSRIDLQILQGSRTFVTQADVAEFGKTTQHGSVRNFTFERCEVATSICTNRGSRKRAMTWLSGSSYRGIAIVPMDDSAVGAEELGPGKAKVSMYTSAAASDSSGLVFAFGSSHGILTASKPYHDLKWLKTEPMEDIWALEFDPNQDDVLLSGGRQGILYCHDLKIPHHKRAAIIDHPSSITHIKQLDSHRILVAGLESSLCQYDLRYLKSDPDSNPSVRYFKWPRNPSTNPDSGISAQARGKCRTRSILQYPDYYNTATRASGFDVDLEAGVIAAAQERNQLQPLVRLFSLWGGNALSCPAVDILYGRGQNPDYEHIKCLRFSRDVDHRMKSLYIGLGRSIERFAWGGRDEHLEHMPSNHNRTTHERLGGDLREAPVTFNDRPLQRPIIFPSHPLIDEENEAEFGFGRRRFSRDEIADEFGE